GSFSGGREGPAEAQDPLSRPGPAPGAEGAPASPGLLYLEGAPAAGPADGVVEIQQEGLQFQPRAVIVRRGMRVSFPNLDREYHNVFSYSKAKRFDLGRFPK